MAGRVMGRKANVAAALQWTMAACCMLPSAFIPVHAADLPDPTRPPSSIFAPVAGPAEDLSSGLHSIIISDIRRAAIIDGKTVELGGEHGGARLVEVNEGGVVLQRAQSRQALSLFPGVKITRKEAPDTVPAATGQISGKKLPGKKLSGENESLNQLSPKEKTPTSEAQVLPQSSAEKMQSGNENTGPGTHHEELLPGHPKEEK